MCIYYIHILLHAYICLCVLRMYLFMMLGVCDMICRHLFKVYRIVWCMYMHNCTFCVGAFVIELFTPYTIFAYLHLTMPNGIPFKRFQIDAL